MSSAGIVENHAGLGLLRSRVDQSWIKALQSLPQEDKHSYRIINNMINDINISKHYASEHSWGIYADWLNFGASWENAHFRASSLGFIFQSWKLPLGYQARLFELV